MFRGWKAQAQVGQIAFSIDNTLVIRVVVSWTVNPVAFCFTDGYHTLPRMRG